MTTPSGMTDEKTEADQSRSAEPSTEAGRALLDDRKSDWLWRAWSGETPGVPNKAKEALRRRIRIIEAEAAAQALSAQPDEGLREALRTLINVAENNLTRTDLSRAAKDKRLIEALNEAEQVYDRALAAEGEKP